MRDPTKKFGPIGSAVLTFIGYKQTDKQAKFIHGCNFLFLTGIDLTYTDYAAIQEIHGYGDQIFKLLVNSLCPSIFGQNVVKVLDAIH